MIPYTGKQTKNGGIADYAREAQSRKCIHGGETEDCKTCERLTNTSEESNNLSTMHQLQTYENELQRLKKQAETAPAYDLPVLRVRYKAILNAKKLYLKDHGLPLGG